MSASGFLQDYVEEVQEHLQDMEKSLLVLEQEGTNHEQISNVFRAAHSLKGASAYMGFEGLAALTHQMESLISEIQHDSRHIPTCGISILLECVDVISKAVEHVRTTGSEPELDATFVEALRSAFSSPKETTTQSAPSVPTDEPESSIIDEEDEELLSIFTESFRANYSTLLNFLKSLPDRSLSEQEKGTARELLVKLVSSAQYMDYEPVVTVLRNWEENLNAPGHDRGSSRQILKSLEQCAAKLEGMIPGLGLHGLNELDSPKEELPIEEEDEELFSIFLEAFQENFNRLAEVLSSSSLVDKDMEGIVELTDGLIQSARYMDYEQIVELLERWNESASTSRMLKGGDCGELYESFLSLASELQKKLNGFNLPDLPCSRPISGIFDTLDVELDSLFDSSTNGAPNAPSCFPAVEENLEVDSLSEEKEEQIKGVLYASARLQPKVPDRLSPASDAPAPESRERTVLYAEEVPHQTVTLRVDAQKVDQLLNQVGELVVTRSEFIQTAATFRDILRDLTTQGVLPKSELRRLRALGFRLNESTQSLGRVANDLQNSVMRVRMLPIIQLFQRLPRVVRDQALKLGKKAELLIEGGNTEVDKRVLDQLTDPLVQLIRNALAHGLETPEERKLAGKPETGTIRIAAYHAGDYVTIEVEDDGRGIDTKKLRNLLRNHREISEHELDNLSEEEIAYSIFIPGISTYDRVDGSAGRGVGLDVVKENVERMNGSVEVESYPGQGTRFVIRIPLTVAIIRALLVREADQVFTIPLSSVTEIVRYRPEATYSIEGFPVITLRGKTIPLVNLRQLLNLRSGQLESNNKFVVIVSTTFREVGLIVDGLMGEREVVIKSIDNGVHSVEGFSGATILGDGKISLIIDVSAMLKMMRNSSVVPQIQGSESLH